MQRAVLLALVGGAAVVIAAAAWTILGADPAAPVQIASVQESLALDSGLTDEGAPAPAPDPFPPDVTTTSATTRPAPKPDPETQRQAEARAIECVTPGWPCHTYTWHFGNATHWMVLQTDPVLYQAYRAEGPDAKPMRLRQVPEGYASDPAYDLYVSDGRDDALVEKIAKELHASAVGAGLDARDELSFALAFVQGLRYTSDNVTTGFDEYPRHPLETLADEGGDCEDTAILYASLVQALAGKAILVAPPGHMAVGVAGLPSDGAGVDLGPVHYLFAETTGEDWQIGTIPPEFVGATFMTWPLDPIPLLYLGATNVASEGSGLRVTAEVGNKGSSADAAQVVAELKSVADGSVLSSRSCNAGAPPTDGGTRSCSLLVDAKPVPKGMSVRLEVRAQIGAQVHDVLRTSAFVPWP